MIEKLLANPFTGDGTLHPDLHLIYVDEVCGLFKLAALQKKYTSVMIRVCHSRSCFLSCMYIHDDFTLVEKEASVQPH